MLTGDGWDTLATVNKPEEHKKKKHYRPGGKQVTVIATNRTHDIVTSVVLSIFTYRTHDIIQTKRKTAKLVII